MKQTYKTAEKIIEINSIYEEVHNHCHDCHEMTSHNLNNADNLTVL